MRKLSGCGLDSAGTAYNNLRNELISVCVRGCDGQNPTGASSVAPNQWSSGSGTPPFNSFEEVIRHYATFIPGICDPALMSTPKPYGHDLFSTLNPLNDTCFNSEYRTSFNDTVVYNNEPYFIPLRNSDALKLYYMTHPLPDSLKCKRCVDCDSLKRALHALNDTYTVDNVPWLRAKYSQLPQDVIRNRLNNILGFNLEYSEYMSFLRNCNGVNDTITDSALVAMTLDHTTGYNFIDPLCNRSATAFDEGVAIKDCQENITIANQLNLDLRSVLVQG
jgi:hypothetical protein